MEKELTYIYEFIFEDGTRREYAVRLNAHDLSLISDEAVIKSDWTRLRFKQCAHCTLDPDEHTHCSIAVNLDQLVSIFKDEHSQRPCTVQVTSKERTYFKETTLQSGLFSLFGLIFASSDCPHLKFLRPLARFHLPFSSMDEAVFKMISAFLASQYLASKKDERLNWNMEELGELCQNLLTVNDGLIKRIRSVSEGSAAHRNAISILDSIASMVAIELTEDFETFKKIFLSTISPPHQS